MPAHPPPGGEVDAPRRRALQWIGGLLVAAVLAALEHALAAFSVKIIPRASAASLAATADGRGSDAARLSFATPAPQAITSWR